MSGLCSPAPFAKARNLIRRFRMKPPTIRTFALARHLGKIDNEKPVPLVKQSAEERLFF